MVGFAFYEEREGNGGGGDGGKKKLELVRHSLKLLLGHRNIEAFCQAFHAALNSLLSDELQGVQELVYELCTENMSFKRCFHLWVNPYDINLI